MNFYRIYDRVKMQIVYHSNNIDEIAEHFSSVLKQTEMTTTPERCTIHSNTHIFDNDGAMHKLSLQPKYSRYSNKIIGYDTDPCYNCNHNARYVLLNKWNSVIPFSKWLKMVQRKPYRYYPEEYKYEIINNRIQAAKKTDKIKKNVKKYFHSYKRPFRCVMANAKALDFNDAECEIDIDAKIYNAVQKYRKAAKNYTLTVGEKENSLFHARASWKHNSKRRHQYKKIKDISHG